MRTIVTTLTVIASARIAFHPLANAADALARAGVDHREGAGRHRQGDGSAAGRAVTVKGTIAAIDKEKNTVMLKGPMGHTIILLDED